jgi:hypothetical protein
MTTATLSGNRIQDSEAPHGTDNDVDAVFASLAVRALDDEGAADELRQLLLPSCRGIAAHLGDSVVAEVVAAAYDEVMDWASAEGHLVR